jgi:hypothetical protein
MSTGGKSEITCPCGHTFKAWIWQSVNVGASPELKASILEGTMNVVECPECGNRFHVETPFLYHDLDAREYVWVYPLASEEEAGRIRSRVAEMWEDVKERMPDNLRGIVERDYRVSVLFGMDALVAHLRQGSERRDGK